MKRRLGTLCLLISCLSLGIAAEHPTTIAQPRDSWWLDRHEEKLKEVEKHGDKIDLVFIGDSITHFMDDRAPGLIERTFPEKRHLNLGYSADRTENVLWRLRNGEIAGISPELVVLMIGTNNTGHRQDPAGETVQGIRLILDELRKQVPNSKVLLLSIFPRGESADDPLRQLNATINRELPRLADGWMVHHLDINKAFLDAEGQLNKELMPDLLHPNDKGYEAWMGAMKAKARELIDLHELPTPPEIWSAYDPDAGDFKEEIVAEETRDGIYHRDSYISAYVLGEEVRVFCKYSVKEGSKRAPGLMDVHGWMGAPHISKDYVDEGWAVMAHDYCGRAKGREHHTRYPESLKRGNMDRAEGPPVWSHFENKESITDSKQSSDYLWYAIQRRVLSYLLSQKEVDADRIGAKGYSYGGTIMWNLAMDERVKAVVAYFGIGWNEYYRSKRAWMYEQPYHQPEMSPGETLYLSSIAPQAHAPHIRAASLWLNGSNDHHGGHERGGETFKWFQADVPWDFAIQARGHHNTEKLGNDCKLWLQKHVLNTEQFWPARPTTGITLNKEGVPRFHIQPASPEKIEALNIYYAQKSPVSFGRAWRDAKAEREGDRWVADLPVLNVDDYVFAFADIRYIGDIVIASDFESAIPALVGKAVATDEPSNQISEGTGMWSNVAPAEGVGGRKGFRIMDRRRGTTNEQFNDPKWKAPEGAELTFKFYCTQPQEVILEVNGHIQRRLKITASDDWQTMKVPAESLINTRNQKSMPSWSDTGSVSIKEAPNFDITQVIFADFEWSTASAISPKVNFPSTDDKVYLTPEMARTNDSFWRVMKDRSVSDQALLIGGKEYARGLGVHADSKLTFALDGKFSTFHVTPGPDDAHHGTLEMIIQVDGKERYRSGPISRESFKEAKPLRIPVTDARQMTLIVESADGQNGGDHANWADAYLER